MSSLTRFLKRGSAPRWEVVLLILSLLLYGICLGLPAFFFFNTNTQTQQVDLGIHVLILGWLGLLIGQVGWVANPVYYLTVFFWLTQKWQATLISGAITLLLAANTLLLFKQNIPANEGGVGSLELQSLGLAFYFWIASLALPLVGGWLGLRSKARP